MGAKAPLLVSARLRLKRITNRPLRSPYYDPWIISPNLLFVKQWYNNFMSPRHHFANYAKQQPKEYEAFSNSMWNGFVSITKHVPIVNRFFSFTPDFLADAIDYKDSDAAEALGQAYAEVYQFSQGIPIDLFDNQSSFEE